MDFILFSLLCAVVALSESLGAKANKQGEAWIIKSNLVGNEFNTLDVQKFEKPTTRSNIATIRDEKTSSLPLTRGPGLAIKSAIDSPVAQNHKVNDLKEAKADNFIVRVDDQDATDNPVEEKRNLKAASNTSFAKKDNTMTVSANHKAGQQTVARKLKVRQEIESNPEVYPGENIGKPYGDPDGYQTIGDGIFLMSTEQEAALTPKTTGSNTQNLDTFLVDSSRTKTFASQQDESHQRAQSKTLPKPSAASLPAILTDLEHSSSQKPKNGTDVANESPNVAENVKSTEKEPTEQDETIEEAKQRNTESLSVKGEKDKAIGAAQTSKVKEGEKAKSREPSSHKEELQASDSEPSADMDAMTPVEVKALQSFQDKLGQEDKVIGNLILTKKVDRGQLDFVEKTNAMLQKENQKQIDNVFEKYKNAETNFVKKNPYVVDKPKLLENIMNTTYKDVTETKRGFLGTNDNLRIENVYNSLLKEDDMISKGLNEKAIVRKAIGRHKNNPEDVQVSKFLDFLEEEDKKTENGDDDNGIKPKKTKKKKFDLKSKNLHLMVIEPSLGTLSDKYSADGTPQLTENDLKHIIGEKGTKKSRKMKKLELLLKKTVKSRSKLKGEAKSGKVLKNKAIRTKKVTEQYVQPKVAEKGVGKKKKGVAADVGVGEMPNKRLSKGKAILFNDPKTHHSQMKILEVTGAKYSKSSTSTLEKPPTTSEKMVVVEKNDKQLESSKSKQEEEKPKEIKHKSLNKLSSKRKSKKLKSLRRTAKVNNFQKTFKMNEGDMSNDLYVSTAAKDKVKPRPSKENKDKEYYWHGTVKPETRQLPTDPTEQIRKFGRISNITPVSFEPSVPEGIGQVIGDSNNIANVGTVTKETTGFGDTTAETDASKGGEPESFSNPVKPVLNKIDENDISSTSFFSASKPRQDTYKQILKQGIDPVAQKFVNSAMNEINDKELERAKGLVDNDDSKVLSLFDQNTLRPKLEEFVDSEHEEGEKESNYGQDHDHTSKHLHGHKKHKVKIVLHLPEQMEGNIQEIHGKDSDTPIGTIKDLTLEYAKSERKPGLGQELADDDEDTLEGILSKPTAKLEEFHPHTTVPSVEYVPETVEGKESNEWNEKDNEDKEHVNGDEQAKEKNNNDYMDTIKSNKLLSMIKHSEDLLQKELGRHENREEETEGFISKANDESDEESSEELHHHEQGESKSVTSKSKQRLKNKKNQKKKESKKLKHYGYEMQPSGSPNIYADQLNYEQKSREVSQEMPTETVSKINQIFNADEHLIPVNFLLEDQKALAKPGIGPLSPKKTKSPTQASSTKKPTSKISALIKSKNEGMDATGLNWRLLKHNPLSHMIPDTHNLHIEGGKIHGGTINGGFIAGGDIEGGDIEGGVITGGKILGGVFKDGRMEDGVLNNGTVEGGVIQGGSISGGKIRAGLVAGGKMKGGEIDGGKLSGGEIDGGVLKSGEIRGGVLKTGSVEGGLLKGGIIEGGHLLGGVMLGGKLKGGVVKSGVIRGGTIEGGVVDGGVIEDGVVIKGGVVKGTFPRNTTVVLDETVSKKTSDDAEELSEKKIEEDILNLSQPTSEAVAVTKPTTAQMFKINVDAAAQDHNVEPASEPSTPKPDDSQSKPADNKEPINIGTLGAPESWPVESKDKGGKQTDSNKHKVAPVSYSSATEQKQKPAIEKPVAAQGGNYNKVKAFVKSPEKTDSARDSSNDDEFQQLAKDTDNADQKSLMMRSPTPVSIMKKVASNFIKSYGTTTRATIDQRPAIAKYHWSLNSVRAGKITGSPGKSMSVIGGIKVRSGVATLNDGIDRGYIDAGDFQGECISDPDVCKKGLTLSLTSKIYKDSVDSPTRMYLFDSGAGSEDSKGMALWVNKGKIEGAVSTRKGTWCLEEEIDQFKDKWVDYVMTWHPMKGLYLYANCELLAVSGFGRGCDVCTRSHCHQQDKNTHLMFGRPNKGPHFKLTHFAAGDITIYEDFFNTEGVTQLCGTNNDYFRQPKPPPKRYLSNLPSKSPLDLSSYVMKKQKLSGASPEFNVPSFYNNPKVVGNEFEVWPTPSGLHFLSALFNTETAIKPAQRETLKVDGGFSDWSSWTSCVGICGGTSMATRYCNKPVPKHGGHDCSTLGPARRTRLCDESNCLAPENLKAIARFEQSEAADIENDISKRKEISRTKTLNVNQERDIDALKEEFAILKHR